MLHHVRFLLLLLAACVVSPALAATDMFLEIKGIPGEAADSQHRDWIEVDSFTWGVSTQTDAATGRASGRPIAQSLVIRKVIDRASPTLYQACAQGQRIPSATLAVREAGVAPMDYLIVELQDVLVSSVSLDGDAAAFPMEEISLAYSKIAWKYTSTDAAGKPTTEVTASWDTGAGSSKVPTTAAVRK